MYHVAEDRRRQWYKNKRLRRDEKPFIGNVGREVISNEDKMIIDGMVVVGTVMMTYDGDCDGI